MSEESFRRKCIQLYDRQSGAVVEERVFGRAFMNFFYGTLPGRLFTRLLLKRRFISRLYGFFQNRRRSVKKIPGFIQQNRINMDEVEKDLSDFDSFNGFFIRQLKSGSRPVDMNPDRLISPADCRLQVYGVDDETVIPVKGSPYTLSLLLGDSKRAEDYRNGYCLVFRLAPPDYHRFGYIDNGRQGPIRSLGTGLDSVNPLVLGKGVPVFTENHRHVCDLETENFGTVQHIDVGAILVGRMVQNKMQGGSCRRGEEKGYFLFGGSTVVLVFKAGVIIPDPDIAEYSAKGIETLVRYGEGIGSRKK